MLDNGFYKKETDSCFTEEEGNCVCQGQSFHLQVRNTTSQNSPASVAMASSGHPNSTTTPSQPIIDHQSDVMIDMLHQLTQSNQSLLERIEKIQQQASTSQQTTVAAGLFTTSQPLASHSALMPQENHSHPPLSQQLFNSALVLQTASARTVSNTLSVSNNCAYGV